ncbi:PTS ascorbate transporter subunit IIC [Streptobacillus moniliformis]|uniref:PTS ascorbate transporter subunit IIC n=1 Tax=Streptobacillus moniliformis TaxID=34105 RepID=UPI0007E44B46|nr:PTS ascorbate transporter subunit IIC [Streptobacillus moniliformis]
MEILTKALIWFGSNVLTNPPFFVGLLVFVGYLLLKKPFYEAFAGFLKATVGYLILNVGAGGLVVTFRPILAGLNTKYNLSASVIDPYFGLNAVNSALETIGLTAAWVMFSLLIGFGINILLVLFRKYTKVRTLFITGHIMQQQATTATWMIFFLLPIFRNFYGAALIGIFSGVYWAVASNLSVEPTQRLTGNAGFAIGHQQMVAVWFADRISPKLGDPKKGVDEIKLPKWLSIFHDDIVATGTLMMVFFGIIMYVLGPEVLLGDKSVAYITGNKSFLIYVVETSLKFAVYLSVLKQGVRMFVSELIISFQGISNTIIPGAIPAVDCAATYGFGSQNAILFGFLFGVLGQFLAIGSLIVLRLFNPLLIPVLIVTGFVPVFFDNATIAVFANKRGGVKAVAITTFISGILQVLLGAVAVVVFGLIGFGGWHGNIDQSTVWLAQGLLIKYLGLSGYILAVVSMLAIPILQYRRCKNKEQYYEGIVEEE